jgi:hypothetical protein
MTKDSETSRTASVLNSGRREFMAKTVSAGVAFGTGTVATSRSALAASDDADSLEQELKSIRQNRNGVVSIQQKQPEEGKMEITERYADATTKTYTASGTCHSAEVHLDGKDYLLTRGAFEAAAADMEDPTASADYTDSISTDASATNTFQDESYSSMSNGKFDVGGTRLGMANARYEPSNNRAQVTAGSYYKGTAAYAEAHIGKNVKIWGSPYESQGGITIKGKYTLDPNAVGRTEASSMVNVYVTGVDSDDERLTGSRKIAERKESIFNRAVTLEQSSTLNTASSFNRVSTLSTSGDNPECAKEDEEFEEEFDAGVLEGDTMFCGASISTSSSSYGETGGGTAPMPSNSVKIDRIEIAHN